MNPEELLYTKTHEWVHVAEESGSKVATMGLSKFAVEALTDLVFIELPQVGSTASAGQPFGEVESVKAVSDVYAPVSGEVLAVNAPLADKLEALSEDPHGAGWLAKIQLADESELSTLLDWPAYQTQCEEEG